MNTIYEANKNNKNAAVGMFKGLCDYIREQGGLDKVGKGTIQLYDKMRKNLLNNHKINAFFKN